MQSSPGSSSTSPQTRPQGSESAQRVSVTSTRPRPAARAREAMMPMAWSGSPEDTATCSPFSKSPEPKPFETTEPCVTVCFGL